MSKTTLSTEKKKQETLSKRAASVEEKNAKKTVTEEYTADKISRTPSAEGVQVLKKKVAARKKTAVGEKSASSVNAPISSQADTILREDCPSQLLRHTKTTASALAQLEKGIESLYRKDFKRAFSELQSLIEKYPNDAEITASARIYLDICRRGEARQKKTPASCDQAYAMGIIEHNANNYDNAIAYFKQSLEKRPRADYIHYSIAASLARNGNDSEAINSLRASVELNKDNIIHAKNDPDFAGLAGHAGFQELLGGARRTQ